MLLEGSCHCRAVTFSVHSKHPYPFNVCYCSICRKTAGSGGFAINLAGDAATLKVTGEENIAVYRARTDGGESPAQRHFCKVCGSALWVFDPRWSALVHPHAGAIDTELPTPPERTHLMLASKAQWVKVCAGEDDRQYAGYPDESIAEWHRRLGLEC